MIADVRPEILVVLQLEDRRRPAVVACYMEGIVLVVLVSHKTLKPALLREARDPGRELFEDLRDRLDPDHIEAMGCVEIPSWPLFAPT